MNHLDPKAWLDEHGDELYRFAHARVRDPSLAEDLVQEALLAAWRGRGHYSGRASERTWLIGILRNKIADHFRALYRERSAIDPTAAEERDLEDFEPGGHWDVRGGRAPRDWGDAIAAFERVDFWAVFDRCLQGLPERAARAFVLSELDEVSSDAICEEMSISANNFWVMMHRARTQLRRCMEINWFGS